MKKLFLILIVLLLVGIAMPQEAQTPMIPTDEYESQLIERYKLVTNALDKLTLEKAQIEYAFETYRSNRIKPLEAEQEPQDEVKELSEE